MIFHAFWRLFILVLLIISTNAMAQPIKIVALGDSLTAGYGLPSADGFVARLEAALVAKGYDVAIVNAGVSGDTSSGARARLDWSVGADVDGAIVEIGANDMLRGVPAAAIRANLEAMIVALKERGLPVLVAGMQAAPNLGADYGAAFNAAYPELAEKHGTLFYPFFLDGVAGNAALNQPDGIHPNAKGVDVIVGRILPSVESLISRAKERR